MLRVGWVTNVTVAMETLIEVEPVDGLKSWLNELNAEMPTVENTHGLE